MAKEKKNKLDDMSFDDDIDLDFGDLDFDLGDVKDDRKPVTKVASGVKKGITDSFTNPSFLHKMLKSALPKEFGKALDMADDATDGIRDLYNSAANELRPVTRDLKRITGKVNSMVGDKLPEKMRKNIDDWVKSGESEGSWGSNYDPEDSMIQSTLSQIFATKDAAEKERDNDRKATEAIKSVVDRKQFEHSFGQLNAIRMSVQSLASYQNTIGVSFQRKSLELQYRSYFAMAELVRSTKQSNADMRAEMKSVIKNTALPDYAKMQTKEYMAQAMRNKFTDSVQQGLFGNGRDFVKNLTENLVKKGKAKLSEFAGDLRTGLAAGEMGLSGVEMASSTGEDLHVEAGGMIGEEIADRYGTKFAAWLRTKLEKDPRVMKAANKTAYIAQNIPQFIKEFSESRTEGYGWKSDIVSGAKDLLRSSFGSTTTVDRDSTASMMKPAVYNNQTHRTLNEIIPGYLARMYRELQIIRTGNDKIDMLTFDHDKGRFTNEADFKNKMVGELFNSSRGDSLKRTTTALVNRVDPNGTLSDEQKTALQKMLLDDKSKTRIFSKERLSDINSYTGANAAHGEAFSKLFQDYFADDELGRKQLNFSADANSLGDDLVIDYARIQNLVNMGYGPILEDAGVLLPNGKIDTNAVLRLYMDGRKDLGIDQAMPGTLRTGGRRRGSRTNITRNNKTVNRVNIVNQMIFGNKSNTPKRPRIKMRPRAKVPGMQQQSFVDLKEMAEEQPVKKPGTDLVLYQPPKAGIDRPNIDANNSTNCGCFDKIVEALDKHSVKEETMQIRDMIGAIGMMLTKGIRVYNVDIAGIKGAAGGADHFGDQTAGAKYDEFRKAATKGAAGFKSFFRNQWDKAAKYGRGKTKQAREAAEKYGSGTSGKAWRDKTMGEFASDAASTAFGLAGAGLKQARKFKEYAKSGLGWAKEKGMEYGGKGVEKAKEIRKELKTRAFDIYIKGRDRATMTAERIRSGDYIDVNTKKIITCVQDITGEVRNRAGEIIMTAEEARAAFAKGTFGVRALRLLTKFKGKVDELTSGIGGLLGMGLKLGKGLMHKGQDKLMEYLDSPVDIYVKGDLNTPVITAIMMRGGNYVSKLTSKVITKPSQIDGVILNTSGEVVLTEDMIKKGLVNANGQPLKTGLGRLAQIMKGKVNKLLKLPKMAMDAAHGIVGGIGNFFKGLIGPEGIIFAGGKKITTAVEEIRDILKERLPINKKLRKGSAEDINEHRKEDADKAEKKADTEKTAESKGSGFMSTLKSLFGKKKDSDKDKDKDDEKSSVLDDIGDAADAASGKGSKLRRMLGWLGKKGRGAIRGIGSLGKYAMGLLGSGAATAATTGAVEAGAGALASGAATAGAGTAAATGTAMAATGATGATVGGGLLASIGAVLTAPVTLGAAAVAAVGIGGYMAYKYFKNKLSTIEKVRYAQYGFLPDENKYFGLIKNLEENCVKCVEFEGGVASLTENGLKVKEIADSFGVDLKDKKQVQQFIQWFRGRFKPVFLTNMTALIKTSREAKTFADIGKLSADDKLKYLNLSQFKEGPYNMMVGPSHDIPELKADGKLVASLYQAAVDEVTKEKEKDGNSKSTTNASKAPASVATSKAAVVSGAIPAAGGAALAAAQPGQISVGKALKLPTGAAGASVAIMGALAGAVVVSANATPMAKVTASKIDALTTIRLKAYGLNEMDIDKVQALTSLETEVLKSVKLNGAKKAEWSGTPEAIANSKAAAFGVETTDPVKVGLWSRWFKTRFLPVYLNYVTMINSATGKSDPALGLQSLKPEGQVATAVALIASSGESGPVWSVSFSPWPGYKLNQSIASTDLNLAGLKEQMSKSKMDEQVGTKTGDAAKKDALAASVAGAGSADQKKNMSLMDRMGSGLKSGWDSVKNAASTMGGVIKDGVVNASNAVGGAISAAGGALKDGVSNLGKAAMTAYSNITSPAGSGAAAIKAFLDYFAPKSTAGVKPTRADRNNNPGNVISNNWTSTHKGYVGSDGRFAIFDSPEHGFESQVRVLTGYLKKGINTLRTIITKYAPAFENDTSGYINGVAKKLGIGPNDIVGPDMLPKIAAAMSTIEGFHGLNLRPGSVLPQPGSQPIKPPVAATPAATPVAPAVATKSLVAAGPVKPPVGAVPASPGASKPATTVPRAPAATPSLDKAASAGYAPAVAPVAAVAASKKANDVSNLAPLTDLLTKSVGVQTETHKVLMAILAALSNGSTKVAKAAVAATANIADTVQNKAPSRNPTQLPSPVVSVAKSIY